MNVIETAERAVLCALFREYPQGFVWIGGSVLQLLYSSPRASFDLDLSAREQTPPAGELIQVVRWALDEVNAVLGCDLAVEDEQAGDPPPGLLRLKVMEGSEPRFLVDFTRIAGQVGDTTVLMMESALGPQAVVVPTGSGLLLLKLEAVLFRHYLKASDVFDVWFLVSRQVRLAPHQRRWLSEEAALRGIEPADVEQRLDRLTPERFLADLRKRVPAEEFHSWNAARARSAIATVRTLVRRGMRCP